jgi:tripartite-type tricarboxylate transporter receptor subunit TctC
VATLSQALTAFLSEPATREYFLKLGMRPLTSTPKEFGDFIRAEIEKWSRVVKASGAKVD